MRFSLRVNNDLDLATLTALARAAETGGFDQLWVSNDLFLRSCPVLLTTLAERTSRILLGSGILNPYSIHPAEIAMLAATLQEASGGRFLLGLGAGADEFLGWAGIERGRPLARTRDALVAIRALLTGGRPADTVPGWRAEGHLRLPPSPTPIYLGGMSPRMLALAGELADGALPLLYPPEHYPTAVAQVRAGIRDADRELDLPACVWVSVAADASAARRALAEKIAYYGASFAPYLLRRAGLSTVDFLPIRDALARRDHESAVALVDDRMLALGIAGDPDEVVRRCRSLADMGARHLSFGPPLGPDPVAAVRILARDVLPHLVRG